MAEYRNGPFIGNVDMVGKGDRRRPEAENKAEIEKRAVETFGEDWLVPPVLRRRRQGHTPPETP